MSRTTALTLTRREGEFIRIGDNVFVEVREARGGTTKITVHAPADVEIVRDEIDELFIYEEDDHCP